MNVNFSQAKITKKMLGGKYNMGVKKNDTTLNLDKTYFEIHVNKEAYKNAKKNKFGWLDYGYALVSKEDGHPVRYGNTSQRFELRIDDCGATYRKGVYRDCERKYKHHRIEAGTVDYSYDYLFGHGDKRWVTWSMWLPEDFRPTRAFQIFFQFHSDKGPYPPAMIFKINKNNGFHVDISTSEGMYEDKSGDACDGSIKFEGGNWCDAVSLKYIIKKYYQIPKLLAGKWNDFVIYDHFNQKDKGEIRIWMNGKQIVHFKGKTLFDDFKGKKTHSTISYGVYEKIEESENRLPLDELRKIPSVHYYDEIWVKNKCEKLDLERLGYSCDKLLEQKGSITPKAVRK